MENRSSAENQRLALCCSPTHPEFAIQKGHNSVSFPPYLPSWENPMTQTTGTPPPAPPPPPLNYQSAPMAQPLVIPPGALWQNRFELCASEGAIFPSRCVKCNSGEGVKMKWKTFSWYPPWVNILILVALLIALIIAMVLTKKITVSYGLCAVHRAKRRNGILLAVGSTLFFIVMIIMAVARENVWFFLLGLLGFLGGIIYAIILIPTFRPREITDRRTARFKGACKEFLGTLPPGPAI
jgi:hypothetical protein